MVPLPQKRAPLFVRDDPNAFGINTIRGSRNVRYSGRDDNNDNGCHHYGERRRPLSLDICPSIHTTLKQ